MNSFYSVNKIISGRGSVSELGTEIRSLGRKVFLVTGVYAMRNYDLLQKVINPLQSAGFEVVLFNKVEPEPGLDTVKSGIRHLKMHSCDVVVGMGGGSAIDAAKAVAGLAHVEGEVDDYFLGRNITAKGLPFIAIPTTAGSGAEVTMNAVLTDDKTMLKQSIRSPFLMADAVMLDPDLTMSMPHSVTAFSGMDALTQAIESYTSKGSSVHTDSLAEKAIYLIGGSLRTAYRQAANVKAREDMLYASNLAGIALTNARLGAVHGLAHSVGVRYGIPHGLVCAVLLPQVMRYNLDAVEDKYAETGKLLGACSPSESQRHAAMSAIRWVEETMKEFRIPKTLYELGLKDRDIPDIIDESLPSGSLKANPKDTDKEALANILSCRLE